MKTELIGNAKVGFSIHGESTDEKLEPCPFCGSREVVVSNTHTNYYNGECQDCGAQGACVGNGAVPTKRDGFSTKQLAQVNHEASFALAVQHWNKRAS
jgi:Lar family restriction alleviation protein